MAWGIEELESLEQAQNQPNIPPVVSAPIDSGKVGWGLKELESLNTQEEFPNATYTQAPLTPDQQIASNIGRSRLGSLGLGALQGINDLMTGAANIGNQMSYPVRRMFGLSQAEPIQRVNIGQYAQHPYFEQAGEFSPAMLPISRLGEAAGMIPKGMEAIQSAVKQVQPWYSQIGRAFSETAPISALYSGVNVAARPENQYPITETAIGGLLGGALGAAGKGIEIGIPSAIRALRTSAISPFSLGPSARPVISDRLNEIKGELSGGHNVNNLGKETYEIAKRNYDEKAGHIDPQEFQYHKEGATPHEAYSQLKSTAQAIPEGSFVPKLHNYNKAINQEISEYEKGIERYGKEHPKRQEVEQKISFLNNFKGGSDESSPMQINDYEGFEWAKRQINDSIRDLKTKQKAGTVNNSDLIGSLGRIRDKLFESLNESSKGTDLAPLLGEADKRWKNEVVKGFRSHHGERESPFFKRYRTEKENPNTDTFITDYVKPGIEKDASTKVQDLLNMLPNQESRNLVSAHILKDARSPEEIMKVWGKLGEKQKQLLFTNHYGEMEKFYQLYKVHPEVFGKETLTEYAPSAVTALAALTHGLLGHPKAALMELGSLGAIQGAKALTKAKASPEAIQAYISQNLPKLKINNPLIQALLGLTKRAIGVGGIKSVPPVIGGY